MAKQKKSEKSQKNQKQTLSPDIQNALEWYNESMKQMARNQSTPATVSENAPDDSKNTPGDSKNTPGEQIKPKQESYRTETEHIQSPETDLSAPSLPAKATQSPHDGKSSPIKMKAYCAEQIEKVRTQYLNKQKQNAKIIKYSCLGLLGILVVCSLFFGVIQTLTVFAKILLSIMVLAIYAAFFVLIIKVRYSHTDSSELKEPKNKGNIQLRNILEPLLTNEIEWLNFSDSIIGHIEDEYKDMGEDPTRGTVASVVNDFNLMSDVIYREKNARESLKFNGNRSGIDFWFSNFDLYYIRNFFLSNSKELIRYQSGQMFTFCLERTANEPIVIGFDRSTGEIRVNAKAIKKLNFSLLELQSAMTALRDHLKCQFAILISDKLLYVYVMSNQNIFKVREPKLPYILNLTQRSNCYFDDIVNQCTEKVAWITGVADIMSKLKGHGLA